ncbi:hypothetical protein DITRI_Ditri20bG0077300 [Diplodiscus trichospermus]
MFRLLSDVIGRVQVLEGNGGVGTLVKITFPPEKDSESSIIRSSIEYEGDDKLAEVASSHVSIKPLEIIAETIGKHLSEKKTTK